MHKANNPFEPHANKPIFFCAALCAVLFLGWGWGIHIGAGVKLSAGKLLVERQLHSLDVVTQFDSWAQLEVHALLNSGQVEQKQGLSVDFLQTMKRGNSGQKRSGGQEKSLFLFHCY